jgi:hypothetical protein
VKDSKTFEKLAFWRKIDFAVGKVGSPQTQSLSEFLKTSGRSSVNASMIDKSLARLPLENG